MKRIVLGACVVAVAAGVMSASAAEEQQASSWADRVVVKGDLRYRHEFINQEGKSTRVRQRIRARFGVYADVNDEVSAGIRLSTGGDDPVSGNQTLGDSFSRKGIGLDQAYFKWSPEMLEGLTLTGGKMGKPWAKVSDLIWDGDLNPEGLAGNYTLKTDAVDLMGNVGGYWVTENSSSDDVMLYGGTLAAKVKADKSMSVMVGGGFWAYENIEESGPLYDDKFFGNSSTGGDDPLFAHGFNIWEGFAKLSIDVGMPMSVYADYAYNSDADDDNKGWLAGFSLGQAKAPNSFEVGYNYRRLEKDAAVGAFVDSDSWGGGTDGKGHKMYAKYAIAKNWGAQATYFVDKKGIDDGVDYKRLQLDLSCKF